MTQTLPSDAGFLDEPRHNYSWIEDAYECARLGTEVGERLTGEDLRIRLVGCGLSEPEHHNAWGALIRRLRNSGRFIPTGRFFNMKRPLAKSRANPEYIVARPAR